MLSDSELRDLKADFLQWTGGFEPETDEDIATYVATSMPLQVSPEDAREALRRWMRPAGDAASSTSR